MTAPNITLVADPDSQLTPKLRNYNNPDAGVCAIAVRPDMRRLGWLGTDILHSIGKPTARGVGADGWAISAAQLLPWLTQSAVQHLVIANAELLQQGWLVDIAQLAQLTDLDLWLVYDTTRTDVLATFAEDFGAETIPHTELASHLPSVPPADPQPDPSPSTYPTAVPDDDVLTFLASSRRTLPADDFEQVYATFVDAYERSQPWLDSIDEPDEDGTAAHLRGLIADQLYLPQVTTTIRGMQAAALRRGWLVKVDPQRFLSRLTETRTSLDLNESDWAALATTSNPRLCAVAALSSLGLTVEAITALPASAVTIDGATVFVDNDVITVPEPARPMLIAQHFYRLAAAPPGSNTYLAGSRKDDDLSPRGITNLVQDATKKSGIGFRARYDRRDPTTKHWRQRTGLCITKVAA